MKFKFIDNYEKDNRFHFIPDDKVKDFLKQKSKLPIVAVDTETHYIADDNKVTRFITKDNTPNNTPFLLTLSDGVTGWAIELNPVTIPHVKSFLENSAIEKVFFNAVYDLEMLLNIGIEVKGKIHDVLIIHHLLDEEDRDENGERIMGLKPLSVKYIAQDADKFESYVDTVRNALAKERKVRKNDISYYHVYLAAKDVMVDYAASDTLYTMILFNKWYPELQKQNLMNVYQIEINCIWAIVSAEMRGYKIDKKRLVEMEKELTVELENITNKIYNLAGKEFNIDSDEQLVEAFMGLGAEYHAITEKGNWKTDKEVLKSYLEHEVPAVRELAESVLEYRSTSKLLNTYIENIKEFMQADGRVHPSFWQTGTRTGRMSSSKPNFQNIDPRAKELFIPDDDYILVFMDAAQQEYRMLAHYAKEHKLIEMIKKGYDVHRATAALLYNKSYEEVTDAERKDGKTFNFAVVYGLGLAAIAKAFGASIDEEKYKLANEIFRRLGLKPWDLPDKQIILNSVREPEEKEAIEYYFSDEVKEAIEFAKKKKAEYFSKFPNIANLLDTVKKVTQRRGWVKTWTGRRKRYKDPWKEAYKAPNALIQGGCGDILKVKAGELYKLFKGKKSGFVNFIHDSIDMEIHKDELDLIPKINEILRDLPFSVPIDWDIEYSTTNWAEKKEFTSLEDLRKELGVEC